MSPESLVARARKLQDVWTDGTPAVTMRTEIQFFHARGKGTPGQYVVSWNSPSRAQSTPRSAESASTELVSRLAPLNKKIHARNLIILDLRGPNGLVHPVGNWLADRLSVIMGGRFPKIEIIEPSRLLPTDEIPSTLADPHRLFDMQVKQTRSVGADSFINADFARISNDQIGVSLTIVALSHLEETHDVASGIVTISEEVMTVSHELRRRSITTRKSLALCSSN